VVRFLIELVKFALSLFVPNTGIEMKKKLLFTAGLILTFAVLLTAQDQPRVPAGISIAFKSGSAAGLSEYLNGTVELVMPDKEDFYSKSVAESILKDFFSRHRTRDFVIKHQGAKGDAQYAIATLETDKGRFRVYFLLKKVEGNPLIHQIRVEPENE
jgi:hypothetical protein